MQLVSNWIGQAKNGSSQGRLATVITQKIIGNVYDRVSQTFCSWVPPKFSHIFSCKAQLALMHNLFSIARQPITFPLNLLNL